MWALYFNIIDLPCCRMDCISVYLNFNIRFVHLAPLHEG